MGGFSVVRLSGVWGGAGAFRVFGVSGGLSWDVVFVRGACGLVLDRVSGLFGRRALVVDGVNESVGVLLRDEERLSGVGDAEVSLAGRLGVLRGSGEIEKMEGGSGEFVVKRVGGRVGESGEFEVRRVSGEFEVCRGIWGPWLVVVSGSPEGVGEVVSIKCLGYEISRVSDLWAVVCGRVFWFIGVEQEEIASGLFPGPGSVGENKMCAFVSVDGLEIERVVGDPGGSGMFRVGDGDNEWKVRVRLDSGGVMGVVGSIVGPELEGSVASKLVARVNSIVGSEVVLGSGEKSGDCEEVERTPEYVRFLEEKWRGEGESEARLARLKLVDLESRVGDLERLVKAGAAYANELAEDERIVREGALGERGDNEANWPKDEKREPWIDAGSVIPAGRLNELVGAMGDRSWSFAGPIVEWGSGSGSPMFGCTIVIHKSSLVETGGLFWCCVQGEWDAIRVNEVGETGGQWCGWLTSLLRAQEKRG